MGFTLAEKPGKGPFQGTPLCDLDAQREDTATGNDLPLGPLLLISAVVLAVVVGAAALPWVATRASVRASRRRRAVAADDDDDDFKSLSPPTPPPASWLRDADADGAAVVHLPYSSYTTPPPLASEPLLFSIASPPGSEPAPYGSGQPYYPPVQPVGGPSGIFPWTASGPAPASSGMGSPSGSARRRRRVGVPGAGGGWGVGWDAGLLSRQAALLPAISSVEGLVASAEFQEHVRASRRRSPQLEREQAQAKVQLYKDLRRMDPDAFRRLLSRTDVQSFDTRAPPLALVIVDYLLGSVALPLALAALAWGALALGPAVLRCVPLLAWLVARLWLASAGHASLLGRVLAVYLVYDSMHDELYGNGWESIAGVGAHILLVLCELAMAVGSVGLLVPGSLACVAFGRRRQTLAMRLLGLRLEREVSRPTTLSPYCPPSEVTAGQGGSASQSPNGSGPGRYGLLRNYR